MFTYEFTFQTNEAGLQGIDQKVRITKPSFTECVDAFKEWAEARSYEFTDLVSVKRIY